MKFELKGQTLNVLVPTVIWTLSVVNMVVAVWPMSGPRFYLGVALIVTVSVGSAWAFDRATTLLRDQATAATRLLLYASLFGGMFAASWDLVPAWPWWEEAEEPSPPPVEPETVDLDGIRMFVPPTPPRSPDLPEDLLGAIAEGERLMKEAKFDEGRCLGEGKGHEKCLGSYLLAAVNNAAQFQRVEVMWKPNLETPAKSDGTYVSTPANFTVTKESGGGFNTAFRVSSPPGWTVVALRRPYRNAEGDVVADTYIPYSPWRLMAGLTSGGTVPRSSPTTTVLLRLDSRVTMP